MKVKLIDVDSKIPNLALMKISAWHKAQGDEVSFDEPEPDALYVSCIFKKNMPQALGLASLYPSVLVDEIYVGGYGIDAKRLPDHIHNMKPDYDLYPSVYSQGYTTRGCIRNCGWCMVPQMEGNIKMDQEVIDFLDDRFDEVMLMDNNILALPDWFFWNTDCILNRDLKVREHGMDIRLLDEKIVARLRELKFASMLHFAWDFMGDGIEKAVMDGLDLLEAGGFNLKQEIDVYVLVGYNTNQAEDKYRCRELKKRGCNAFVMPYVKNKWTSKIAWWANRKHAYWACDIDDVVR